MQSPFTHGSATHIDGVVSLVVVVVRVVFVGAVTVEVVVVNADAAGVVERIIVVVDVYMVADVDAIVVVGPGFVDISVVEIGLDVVAGIDMDVVGGA